MVASYEKLSTKHIVRYLQIGAKPSAFAVGMLRGISEKNPHSDRPWRQPPSRGSGNPVCTQTRAHKRTSARACADERQLQAAAECEAVDGGDDRHCTFLEAEHPMQQGRALGLDVRPNIHVGARVHAHAPRARMCACVRAYPALPRPSCTGSLSLALPMPPTKSAPAQKERPAPYNTAPLTSPVLAFASISLMAALTPNFSSEALLVWRTCAPTVGEPRAKGVNRKLVELDEGDAVANRQVGCVGAGLAHRLMEKQKCERSVLTPVDCLSNPL